MHTIKIFISGKNSVIWEARKKTKTKQSVVSRVKLRINLQLAEKPRGDHFWMSIKSGCFHDKL